MLDSGIQVGLTDLSLSGSHGLLGQFPCCFAFIGRGAIGICATRGKSFSRRGKLPPPK